jgi:Protein of unknown function (DUF2752)
LNGLHEIEQDMEIYFFPDWLLKKLPLQPVQQIHAGYFFSSLLALAFVYLVQWIPHVCLMQVCFGLPCPGCGITHSLRALFAGQWQASRAANPAGMVIALCLAFQLVARPFAVFHSTSSVFVERGSRVLGTVACGTILIHWLFQLL